MSAKARNKSRLPRPASDVLFLCGRPTTTTATLSSFSPDLCPSLFAPAVRTHIFFLWRFRVFSEEALQSRMVFQNRTLLKVSSSDHNFIRVSLATWTLSCFSTLRFRSAQLTVLNKFLGVYEGEWGRPLPSFLDFTKNRFKGVKYIGCLVKVKKLKPLLIGAEKPFNASEGFGMNLLNPDTVL